MLHHSSNTKPSIQKCVIWNCTLTICLVLLMKCFLFDISAMSRWNFLGLDSTMLSLQLRNFMLPSKRYLWNEWSPLKRILMVSSRSSRSHSMERRLFRSSLVVQSNSSLEAPPACNRSSLHLWWRLCAAFTAFWTSLLHKWHKSDVVTLRFRKYLTSVELWWSGFPNYSTTPRGEWEYSVRRAIYSSVLTILWIVLIILY